MVAVPGPSRLPTAQFPTGPLGIGLNALPAESSASLAALKTTFAAQLDRCRILTVVGRRVLDFACGDVYDQLAELARVAWALA